MHLIDSSLAASCPAVLRLTWHNSPFETYCHHASIEIQHSPTLFSPEFVRVDIKAHTAKVNKGKIVGGYDKVHTFHLPCVDNGDRLSLPLDHPDVIDLLLLNIWTKPKQNPDGTYKTPPALKCYPLELSVISDIFRRIYKFDSAQNLTPALMCNPHLPQGEGKKELLIAL